MRSRSPHESAARWLLAAVTVVLAASMGGGFLLLPVLVPLHVWAARRSGRVGRIGWSLLPALSLSMVAWAGVYAIAGESKPAIWLLPAAVLLVTMMIVLRVATSDEEQQLR